MSRHLIWLVLLVPFIMGAIVIRPLIQDTPPYIWQFENLEGRVHDKREWHCSNEPDGLVFRQNVGGGFIDRVQQDGTGTGEKVNCNYIHPLNTAQQLIQFCYGCEGGTCDDNAAHRASIRFRGTSGTAWTDGYEVGTDPVAETLSWDRITGETTLASVASTAHTTGDPQCETYAIELAGDNTLIHYWDTGVLIPSLPDQPTASDLQTVLGTPTATLGPVSIGTPQDSGTYVGMMGIWASSTDTWIDDWRAYDWTGTLAGGQNPPFFDDFDGKSGNWEADANWLCHRSTTDAACGAAAVLANDRVETGSGFNDYSYLMGVYQAQTNTVQQWAYICDAENFGSGSNFPAALLRCEDAAQGDCYGLGWDTSTVYWATYTPSGGYVETIATAGLTGAGPNDCMAVAIELTGSANTRLHYWLRTDGTPPPSPGSNPSGTDLINSWGTPTGTFDGPTITDVHDTGRYCGASFNARNNTTPDELHGIDDWGCGDWSGTINPAPPGDVCGDGQITGSEICDPVPNSYPPDPHQGCSGGTPICSQPDCQSCIAESGPPPGTASCTTGSSGSLTVGCLATKFVGPAPLAVGFDAGTVSTRAGTDTWDEITYDWNFGDSGSGTWASTGKSKNLHTGPVAAHTYQTPGFYTVNVTGTHPESGNTATAQITIEVTSPDAQWSGNLTWCFTTGADFTGCPAGAVQSGGATWNDICFSLQQVGRRTLVRRGDVINADSQQCDLSVGTAPSMFGAYGSGAKPLFQRGVPGFDQHILRGSSAQAGTTNWRIMDIAVENTRYAPNFDSGGAVMVGRSRMENILFLNIDCYECGGVGWNLGVDELLYRNSPPHYDVHWEDVTFNGSGVSWGIYLCGHYSSVQGARWLQGQASHNLRGACWDRNVVANNAFKRWQFDPSGRHSIKMHCQEYPSTGNIPDRCDYTQVSDNIFDNSEHPAVTMMVDIGPQNGIVDERLYNILVERNIFHGGSDQIDYLGYEGCGGFTARQNILNSSNTTNRSANFIGVNKSSECPGDPIDDVQIHYNTCSTYTNPDGNRCIILQSAVESATTEVAGNAMYNAPGNLATLIENNSGGALAREENNWFGTSNPFQGSSPNLNAVDYTPAAGSPLLNYNPDGGSLVPGVQKDFFDSVRGAYPYDGGAIER